MNESLHRPRPLLSSPTCLLLPVLDRHHSRRSRCVETVNDEWPRIERSFDSGEAEAAIAAMERLAATMYELAPGDPAPYRPILRQQRLLLYGHLVAAARYADLEAIARLALSRCQRWDTELATELEELSTQL